MNFLEYNQVMTQDHFMNPHHVEEFEFMNLE